MQRGVSYFKPVRGGRVMFRLLLIAILCLGMVYCQTVPHVSPVAVSPVEYEPDLHCDKKHMALRKDIPDAAWIRRGDVRKLENAINECAIYTHETNVKNAGIAEHNRKAAEASEDARTKTFFYGVGIGALIPIAARIALFLFTGV